MTTTAKITCRVDATASGLTLIAKINDQAFWRGDPWGGHDLALDLPDDDGSYQLVFELSGKTVDHTKIDSSGQIIQDVTVSIGDLSFDGIDLGYLSCKHSTYEHDSNGTGPLIQDKFYGIMGCNGKVSLKFTTPVYLWLLENM